MSPHVARSSSCALSFADRTTRRSSSLSLSDEPMRKRLAPFFWLDPLLLELLLLESESEPDEEPSSAKRENDVLGRHKVNGGGWGGWAVGAEEWMGGRVRGWGGEGAGCWCL